MLQVHGSGMTGLLTMKDNDGPLWSSLQVRSHALKVQTHCLWVKVPAEDQHYNVSRLVESSAVSAPDLLILRLVDPETSA